MVAPFDEPYFRDDEAAREFLEGLLWPAGPICRHCGTVNRAYKTKRPGVYRCAEKACRKDFSVTKGTVLERSHIPLHKWLLAFYLVASSKKGISAHQLHRTLVIGYEAAWFMEHRIREAMRDGGLAPLGGAGRTVEADETFIGRLAGMPKKHYGGSQSYKNTVLTLVERGGSARSFHLESTTVGQIVPVVNANIARESSFMTDEARHYEAVGATFADHGTVTHSVKEYVRGNVHTNTVEGFYSIFKRGMKGVYQHCREKHLHRYPAEYDFRYSHRSKLGFNDLDRT